MTAKTMAEVLAEHTYDRLHAVCSCSDLVQVGLKCDRQTHPEHVAEVLSAAGYGLVAEAKREALEDLLAAESLERARKIIEDELIDWRDSGLFMLRNNGLAVRNKDGSGSEIIRFGFEDGLRIAVKDHAARAAGMRQG